MYIADLHIHSRFSRATSKDGDLPHLDWWAERLASLGARVRILPSRGKEAYHAA